MPYATSAQHPPQWCRLWGCASLRLGSPASLCGDYTGSDKDRDVCNIPVTKWQSQIAGHLEKIDIPVNREWSDWSNECSHSSYFGCLRGTISTVCHCLSIANIWLVKNHNPSCGLSGSTLQFLKRLNYQHLCLNTCRNNNQSVSSKGETDEMKAVLYNYGLYLQGVFLRCYPIPV